MFEKEESGYLLFARDKVERRWHKIIGGEGREIYVVLEGHGWRYQCTSSVQQKQGLVY
jgi:hypothetical protein